MEQITEPFYRFCKAKPWAQSLSDEAIKNLIQETEFSREQTELGRDFCFFLNKNFYTDDEKNADYALMAYTLSQPENLERISMYDMVLEENEHFEIHRISVLRNGVLIDKIPDTTIKVLDNENQSGGGILSRSKKLNISIRDLHLNDVIILEDCKVKTFAEKEFLRKDFAKHVYVSPDTYWAYGHYNYRFINERSKRIAYKKCFFRDAQGEVLPSAVEYLEKGAFFELNYTNYINPVDANRELYPFVDFVTDASWNELSNYIFPLYKEAFEQSDLKEFAPDLIEKLDALPTADEKIRFAIEFVQNNIYYIFNSDEMNGHQPQLPAVTYQNKQGDCKAKSVLLKIILDYLNVDSSVVLVNYSNDFYLKYYLPSLLSFNHVILKINHNNATYFVDATARNEFGILENRSVPNFCFYMEIAPNQELEIRQPIYLKNYALDENVHLKATGNQGELAVQTTYRYNRANNMRNYFRNTNRKEILDSWNNSLFYALNYVSDRNGKDFRDIFKDAAIDIVSDDKNANEFTVLYKASIEQPYFVDPKGNRFLMYFDRSALKNSLRDFQHKDASYWHGFDSERYEIFLETDQKIDTEERFTVQECDISNKYFKYQTKKTITKHSGKTEIIYNPLLNIEIPLNEMEAVKSDYHRIADSHFGLGIDILEPGIVNFLKRKFGKN